MATVTGTSGNDTLLGSIDPDTLDGLEGDDRLDGSLGADSLLGGSGNDTLIGSEAGAPIGDTLVGGAGDDLYEIANPLDLIVEAAGEGTDELRTGLAAFTLPDQVETLTYTGTADFTGTGNDLDNRITGGTGADSLSGGAGNDTLIGGGGADTLAGGLGDDSYRIDNAGVQVVEAVVGCGARQSVEVTGAHRVAHGGHRDAITDLVAAERLERMGLSTWIRSMTQRRPGRQYTASKMPRAADGVITS